MSDALRRTRLFIGSYALLFLLLALRFRSLELQITFGILAGTGFVDMVWIVFGVSKRTGSEPFRVAAVSDAGPAITGYLATYLLPFLTVPEPDTRDLVAYAIFLVVTGLVYVRSEMTQINPTLYILGRRVVEITTVGGWRGYVVARSSVDVDSVIRTVPLNPAVRVEVSRRGAPID